MHNRPLFLAVVMVTLLVNFILFNRAYLALRDYSEYSNRHLLINGMFQQLYRDVDNAAVLHPGMGWPGDTVNEQSLFFTDSATLMKQVAQLKASVRDSVNNRIADSLSKILNAEVGWILKSSIPDTIVSGTAPEHIAAFVKIDSLLKAGINRTKYLIAYRDQQIHEQTRNVLWQIILFVAIAAILLIYTSVNFFRQRLKTEYREKELATIFKRISDGVVSLDSNWRYTFLNDAALAGIPLSKKEILGKSIWQLFPEMKGTTFWEKCYEATETMKEIEMENYYAPSGSWYSLKLYPDKDGLTIFYKSIDDKKVAEQRLEDSLSETSYYKFALDQSSIVAITDQKGVIRYANDNFCLISKYSREELIGQDHRIINSGYHSKDFIRNIWVTIANGKIWKGEIKNKAKDGTIYWVDTTIVPLLDKNGKPVQYLAIRADITERKKGEEEINKLNAELEEKVVTRTAELQTAKNEMEAFTYSVSHDLRAPLRGIIGFANILDEDYGARLDDEAKRITGIIKSNTMKMGQLIDDLLDFSRIGKKEIVKSTVDMNKMVHDIINEIDGKEKIQWHVENLDPVRADASMIRQVWVNLISNAVKYSGKKAAPTITIRSGVVGRQVNYSVKDNGVGFDEAYKEKLFKVFQRLHGPDEFEGTGVGLALVEKIVSKHGGKVWAEGKEDEGACFSFSLPR